MDLIPDRTQFDFAKNVFPLMSKDADIQLVAESYWCDVSIRERNSNP